MEVLFLSSYPPSNRLNSIKGGLNHTFCEVPFFVVDRGRGRGGEKDGRAVRNGERTHEWKKMFFFCCLEDTVIQITK